MTTSLHESADSRNTRFVKVDASDPKAVAQTLEIIRLLYAVHSNSWSPLYRIRKNVRFHDLQMVFAHCWRGTELPDDDAGRDHLYIAACHIWHLDKKHGWIAALRAWVKVWAPWCHTDELSELTDLVDANPKTWTADQLAHELGLYVLPFAVRQALGITMIGSIDLDKEGRRQRRAGKKRENNTAWRRRNGAVARSEWLIENNANQTEPWVGLGMKRSWYYECKRRGTLEINGVSGPVQSQETTDRTRPDTAKRREALVYPDQSGDPDAQTFDRGPPQAAPRQPPRLIRLDDVPDGKIIDQDGNEFEIPQPYERPVPKTWREAAFAGYKGERP
jgi:hypothetical protein